MYISQYCCNATVAVLALSHDSIALGENEDRTLSRQIGSCVTPSSKNGGTKVVTVRQCDSATVKVYHTYITLVGVTIWIRRMILLMCGRWCHLLSKWALDNTNLVAFPPLKILCWLCDKETVCKQP